MRAQPRPADGDDGAVGTECLGGAEDAVAHGMHCLRWGWRGSRGPGRRGRPTLRGTGRRRETFSPCAPYRRAVPVCVRPSEEPHDHRRHPSHSDRRISPVFLGILAVTAVTGWATWTGFAEQPGVAVFLFVTAAWIVSRCLHEYAHAVPLCTAATHRSARRATSP
ncbi:hypothetical protein GCM10023238_26650 [Streptomyces heliomycini]